MATRPIGEAEGLEESGLRFEIRERIGAGGMGSVFSAFDHKRGHEVALKRMQRVDPTHLYLFKREFRVVADVSHQNLVQLYELLSDDDGWFYTMELVEGVGFLEYVRPGSADDSAAPRFLSNEATMSIEAGRPSLVSGVASPETYLPSPTLGEVPDLPDAQRLRRVLIQLVQGAQALHLAGAVHRDLKPSNVLVTPSGRVVICDFGIAFDSRSDARDRELDELVMGTLAYTAPEQISGASIAPAADLYSIGVMLYQSLLGVVPVRPRNVEEALTLKRRFRALPPKEINAAVPDDLNDICVGLLEANPASRMTSEQVLARLQPNEDIDARLEVSTPTRFIARQGELSEMFRAYERCVAGRVVELRVSGAPGMGKSALIRSFLDSLSNNADQETLILESRAYERESVPFKALDAAIDQLARHMLNLPTEVATALLPQDMAALVAMFPVFRRVPAIEQLEEVKGGDVQAMRHRARLALRDLLEKLSAQQPVVVYLEDVQWGDAESASFLHEVLGSPGRIRILIIESFRTEEAAASPFLMELENAREPAHRETSRQSIEVGPLTEDESISLASTLLPQERQNVASLVARESRGSPLFVETLCGYVSAGAQLGADETSLSFSRVLIRRAGQQSPAAQSLLHAVCLTITPTLESVLREALSLGTEWERAKAGLRAANLIRSTASGEEARLEPYHDRVREVIGARVVASESVAVHLRLAKALEASQQRPLEIAHHFAEAGAWDRAMPYAVEAAASSLAQYAYESAASLLAVARRGASDEAGDVVLRRRTFEMCGDVAMFRGEFELAKQEYGKALSLADSLATRSAIEVKVATISMQRGYYTESARLFERTLVGMGRRVPKPGAGISWAAVEALAKQGLHTLAPHTFIGRSGEIGSEALTEAQIYSELTHCYFSSGDARLAWAHFSGLNLVELYAPTPLRGRLWSEHALAMLMFNLRTRAERYGRQALETAEELKDPAEEAHALTRFGTVLYLASDWARAIPMLAKAHRLAVRVGDSREALVAMNHMALSHYRQGELTKAIAVALEAQGEALKVGDHHAYTTTLMVLALAKQGDVDCEEILELMASEEDHLAVGMMTRGAAVALRRRGRHEEALKALNELEERLTRESMNSPYLSAATCVELATTYRELAEKTPATKDRKVALRKAKRFARVAARWAKRYTNDRPAALREQGLVALALGDRRGAQRHLSRSLAIGQAQGAALELKRTRSALGE